MDIAFKRLSVYLAFMLLLAIFKKIRERKLFSNFRKSLSAISDTIKLEVVHI